MRQARTVLAAPAAERKAGLAAPSSYGSSFLIWQALLAPFAPLRMRVQAWPLDLRMSEQQAAARRLPHMDLCLMWPPSS